MLQAHLADRIFTGVEWLSNHAIRVQGGIIQDIVPQEEVTLASNINVSIYANGFIAPSFIDIQIYGAHNSLLAVDPTADSLRKTFISLRKGCVTMTGRNDNTVGVYQFNYVCTAYFRGKSDHRNYTLSIFQ